MSNSSKAPDGGDDCEGGCEECKGSGDPPGDTKDQTTKRGTVRYSYTVHIRDALELQKPQEPQEIKEPQEPPRAQEPQGNEGENNEAVKHWLETLPDAVLPPEDNTPQDLADNLPGIGDKIINYAALSSSDSDSSYGEYDKTKNSPVVSNPEEFVEQDQGTMNVQGHLFPLPPTGGAPYTPETTGLKSTFSGLESSVSSSDDTRKEGKGTGEGQEGQKVQGSNVSQSDEDATSTSVLFILGSDGSEGGNLGETRGQNAGAYPTPQTDQTPAGGKEQPTASNPEGASTEAACSSSNDAQEGSSGGSSKETP